MLRFGKILNCEWHFTALTPPLSSCFTRDQTIGNSTVFSWRPHRDGCFTQETRSV